MCALLFVSIVRIVFRKASVDADVDMGADQAAAVNVDGEPSPVEDVADAPTDETTVDVDVDTGDAVTSVDAAPAYASSSEEEEVLVEGGGF